MDPELKKMLEELRGKVGKNADIAARVDQMEQNLISTGKTVEDLKAARKELDDLKQLVAGVTTVLTSGIANITYTATAAVA